MTTPAPGSGPASAGPALEMLDTPWAQRLDKKVSAPERGSAPHTRRASLAAGHAEGALVPIGLTSPPPPLASHPHCLLSVAQLFSYLTVYRSIPAFLAAVTLDCFDRTTLSNTQMANVAAMLGGGDDDAAEAGGAGLARGGGGAGRPAAARQAWDSDGDANG